MKRSVEGVATMAGKMPFPSAWTYVAAFALSWVAPASAQSNVSEPGLVPQACSTPPAQRACQRRQNGSWTQVPDGTSCEDCNSCDGGSTCYGGRCLPAGSGLSSINLPEPVAPSSSVPPSPVPGASA